MTASDIINKYIAFFENRGHKKIANSPLVPQNDPTTLFTSSGMQPLVPYLLGEEHPQGKRLVNVQNCFRAVDIDEIGDNRHTTFFRMLGNWSLGDYFKKEQLTWIYEFLTKELHLNPERLFVTVFEGLNNVPKDNESIEIWEDIFKKNGINPEGKIFPYGIDKNWWSRSGPPHKMPQGEPGGPDSEIFYDFGAQFKIHEKSPYNKKECHLNCDCGRYIEIANSVFMQYQKIDDGSLIPLPKPNVDFGGGLERLLLASEHQPDVFKTSLFLPIINDLEKQTNKSYEEYENDFRIITDHLIASSFIILEGVTPSNTEQGYILRRLIRRALDRFSKLNGLQIEAIIETVINQYMDTDKIMATSFEKIKNTILEEKNKYDIIFSQKNIQAIQNKISTEPSIYKNVLTENVDKYLKIKPEDFLRTKTYTSLASVAAGTVAFDAQSTRGYPLDSAMELIHQKLGNEFNEKEAREAAQVLQQQHQALSRKGGEQKFRGGLADHQEKTIMGHTATHLLHQALRDLLGKHVHQSGSNITTERLRFDFNYDQKLTDEQITKLEVVVNKKIKENIPVHFEMIPTEDAHKIGAIGLFMDTYGEKSKIYFIGGDSKHPEKAYSIEFCGGPHVEFTGKLKSFKIIKQENIGNKQRRLYAIVGQE